mgnify:CR=1 FL=1
MVEVPSSSDNSEIEQVQEEREVVVERVRESSLDVEEDEYSGNEEEDYDPDVIN